MGAHGLVVETKGGTTLGTRALMAFRQLYRRAWEEPRVSERRPKPSLVVILRPVHDLST